MKTLDMLGNAQWVWKGKHIPLKKLHDKQLQHIREFVGRNPGTWYALSSDFWSNEIKTLLDYRRIDKSLTKQIKRK